MTSALPHDERPLDHTPVHTDALPATPVRDRRIPAEAWIEAPDELLALGARAASLGTSDDVGGDAVTSFLRRIGPWLLWRSGPARGPAIYWAGHVDDLRRSHVLTLAADGTASGRGPSGADHQRFRTWKEDLRDHP
ncbi:hypothetical protein [Desertimonas flava]|uniref:hypothetical protein n=1 Tax=Desertimonas flava TaxID=2064846 RepID=UPI000E3465DE|nr:hypothetical protein [Desertimonas flava]